MKAITKKNGYRHIESNYVKIESEFMKRPKTCLEKLFFILILTFAFTAFNQAKDKKKISKLDELLLFTYPTDIKASEFLVSESEINTLAKEVKNYF